MKNERSSTTVLNFLWIVSFFIPVAVLCSLPVVVESNSAGILGAALVGTVVQCGVLLCVIVHRLITPENKSELFGLLILNVALALFYPGALLLMMWAFAAAMDGINT